MNVRSTLNQAYVRAHCFVPVQCIPVPRLETHTRITEARFLSAVLLSKKPSCFIEIQVPFLRVAALQCSVILDGGL